MSKTLETIKKLSEIEGIQMTHMTNGAHFQFIKDVADRIATETALIGNDKAKRAAELLAAALKKKKTAVCSSPKRALQPTTSRNSTSSATRCSSATSRPFAAS